MVHEGKGEGKTSYSGAKDPNQKERSKIIVKCSGAAPGLPLRTNHVLSKETVISSRQNRENINSLNRSKHPEKPQISQLYDTGEDIGKHRELEVGNILSRKSEESNDHNQSSGSGRQSIDSSRPSLDSNRLSSDSGTPSTENKKQPNEVNVECEESNAFEESFDISIKNKNLLSVIKQNKRRQSSLSSICDRIDRLNLDEDNSFTSDTQEVANSEAIITNGKHEDPDEYFPATSIKSEESSGEFLPAVSAIKLDETFVTTGFEGNTVPEGTEETEQFLPAVSRIKPEENSSADYSNLRELNDVTVAKLEANSEEFLPAVTDETKQSNVNNIEEIPGRNSEQFFAAIKPAEQTIVTDSENVNFPVKVEDSDNQNSSFGNSQEISDQNSLTKDLTPGKNICDFAPVPVSKLLNETVVDKHISEIVAAKPKDISDNSPASLIVNLNSTNPGLEKRSLFVGDTFVTSENNCGEFASVLENKQNNLVPGSSPKKLLEISVNDGSSELDKTVSCIESDDLCIDVSANTLEDSATCDLPPTNSPSAQESSVNGCIQSDSVKTEAENCDRTFVGDNNCYLSPAVSPHTVEILQNGNNQITPVKSEETESSSKNLLPDTNCNLPSVVSLKTVEVSAGSDAPDISVKSASKSKPIGPDTNCNFKMSDMVEKLNQQQAEISDLKLKLNAAQQHNASLELQIRQNEEIVIKTQAEALRTEQNYQQEVKQLKHKLNENSKIIEKDRIRELEEQQKEAKVREAKLLAEISQRTKDDVNYQKIMDQYEITLKARISETKKFQEENETIRTHLTNLELAFSDVHSKYEKTKAALQEVKANEETLLTGLELAQSTNIQHEERYESLKAHARTQIEKSNKEIHDVKEQHDLEINKLRAFIRRLEIKVSSLEVSLQQKTEECEQLSALCDEVTGKRV